ncbi:putative aspartic proteinase GIP1 [Sesamum angolense]|uniref:Aspartic proteinase GIP1 n=1 Tax=Sesamum angolense TaxID=2727404 RepID=A0AAE1XA27_9LAMI|nr:putative aspartic proteinase GIP1 [Sesamum angolense]
MSPHPIIILTFFVVFFSFFVLQSTRAQTLITPIRKDKSTNLYTLSVYLKTPLQRSKLHLDLGSYFPWHDCARHYSSSSSYRPIHGNTPLCDEMEPNVILNCFELARPSCANNSCGFYPENPAQPGPVSKLLLSCVNTTIFSKLLRGLAGGSVGVASLGRYNHSLPAQLSKSFSSPQIFAVCLPSSVKDPGSVWFNYPGPYYFSPGRMDLSKLLTYTPLITAPRGSDTQSYYYYPSPEYYLGLTSIKVSGKSIALNKTLLAIVELGLGGVKISSSKPYSELQTSILQALTDAFVKEAGRLNPAGC